MSKRFLPNEALRGARDVTPLMLGAAAYGVAFGLLASQAAFGGLEVGVMGTIVFAGASQIIAVERLLAGAGAGLALLAGVALNLRLLLVTASLRDIYVGRPFWQVAFGAHLASDENWALLLSKRAEGATVGYWYLVGAGGALMAAWVAATTLGALSSAALPEPRALGMDFAFTAAFIAIARSLWRGPVDIAPWLVAFAVAAATQTTGVIDGSWGLVLAGLTGAAAAAAWPERRRGDAHP